MGLLSCFGLRTKSYNAKKYELNVEKKDKKRVSTDSFGVADTNVHPQLIEETGGGIHPITAILKDSNENFCQSTDNQINQINCNGDNDKYGEQVVKKVDKRDEECEDKPNQVLTQNDIQNDHQKDSVVDNQTTTDSDHQIHSTSDQTTSVGCDSGNHSHSTDQNTVSMDTSDMSGGVVDSSSGAADSSGFE